MTKNIKYGEFNGELKYNGLTPGKMYILIYLIKRVKDDKTIAMERFCFKAEEPNGVVKVNFKFHDLKEDDYRLVYHII